MIVCVVGGRGTSTSNHCFVKVIMCFSSANKRAFALFLGGRCSSGAF